MNTGKVEKEKEKVKIVPKIIPKIVPLQNINISTSTSLGVETKKEVGKEVRKEVKRSLELVIDKREVHSQKFAAFFEDKKQKIQIIHENLEVGDFLFRYKILSNPNSLCSLDTSHSSNNSEILNDVKYEDIILIERKTISDMLSSIKSDNRYKDQKMRLKAKQDSDINLRIFYLIEGIFSVQKTDKYFTEIDRKIMSGAYLGTIVRDQIPVIQTKDLNDTISALLKISNLIQEYPEAFTSNSYSSSSETSEKPETSERSEYLIPVKIKKSENRDARWCYLAMLQQIQGVSEQVAVEIAEVYPNISSLLEGYKKAASKNTFLEDLVLPDRKLTKTGKTRTLGLALAEVIWESLGKPYS